MQDFNTAKKVESNSAEAMNDEQIDERDQETDAPQGNVSPLSLDKKKKNFDGSLFDHSQNLDVDEDFWFKLRGNSINHLIDVSEPLIGLVCRVRKLKQYQDTKELYDQVVDEIKNIDIELANKEYERAVMLSYRYVLCTFVDEAIMQTEWGAQSYWSEHSLLARFHNETWGGEKVFSILARVETEPKRYRELIEFIFLCMCLGFRGRYKVNSGEEEKYHRIIRDLYELLSRDQDTELPDSILLHKATKHVVSTKSTLSKTMPVWTVLAGFGAALVAVFIFYYVNLSQKTEGVLEKLNQILN